MPDPKHAPGEVSEAEVEAFDEQAAWEAFEKWCGPRAYGADEHAGFYAGFIAGSRARAAQEPETNVG